MATERQKAAITNIVENGGNVSKAMRDAGYSHETAKTPKKLTESIAYKDFQALAETYLPDDLLLGSLADDIEKKVGNRTPELTLALKVRGKMNDKLDITSDGEKIETGVVILPAKE